MKKKFANRMSASEDSRHILTNIDTFSWAESMGDSIPTAPMFDHANTTTTFGCFWMNRIVVFIQDLKTLQYLRFLLINENKTFSQTNCILAQQMFLCKLYLPHLSHTLKDILFSCEQLMSDFWSTVFGAIKYSHISNLLIAKAFSKYLLFSCDRQNHHFFAVF